MGQPRVSSEKKIPSKAHVTHSSSINVTTGKGHSDWLVPKAPITNAAGGTFCDIFLDFQGKTCLDISGESPGTG